MSDVFTRDLAIALHRQLHAILGLLTLSFPTRGDRTKGEPLAPPQGFSRASTHGGKSST